jgi:hypothetical protein
MSPWGAVFVTMPLPPPATNRNSNNNIIISSSHRTQFPNIVPLICKKQANNQFITSTQAKYQQHVDKFLQYQQHEQQQQNKNNKHKNSYSNIL